MSNMQNVYCMFTIRSLLSGRFLSDVTENGWNDDGCGKKGVFPEKYLVGDLDFFEKRGFLGNGKLDVFLGSKNPIGRDDRG